METVLQNMDRKDGRETESEVGAHTRSPQPPPLSPWPFLLIDGTLLVAAAALLNTAERPLPFSMGGLIAALVVVGGAIALFPFWRAYRNELKFAELEAVEETVRRIEDLTKVADRVERAETSWMQAKDSSETIAKNLNETTSLLYEESKAIREFAHQQNDQQKANLRLEVQKLKQWETEWVQAGTIALDHTAALHAAILQLDDAQATRKLNKFQNSIHEIMRRVGLVGFAPRAGAPFDPDANRVHNQSAPPPEGSRIRDVVAMGIRYQGRLVRPAIVNVAPPSPDEPIEQELFQDPVSES